MMQQRQKNMKPQELLMYILWTLFTVNKRLFSKTMINKFRNRSGELRLVDDVMSFQFWWGSSWSQHHLENGK